MESRRVFFVAHIVEDDALQFCVPENLRLTAKAPENGWLEYDRFLLRWPFFRGELLVLGSVSFP